MWIKMRNSAVSWKLKNTEKLQMKILVIPPTLEKEKEE